MQCYQYIKILTCVCLSVHDGSGLLVGRDWTIVTRDLRTSYFNLFTEPRRMFENVNVGLESGWGCKRMHAVGSSSGSEQQLKQTQSGSSSRSGRDRDQQLKRTQSRSSRRKRGAAAEADLIGGQADAIGEQQLCTESCPAPDYSR